jgi:mono/diheme cytochrome c family protein
MGNWRAFRFGIWLGAIVGAAANVQIMSLEGGESTVSLNWRAPARAARMANPVAASPQAINRGKALYVQECVACHGKTGRGDGPKAPDLKINPGDFSKAASTRQSDGELFWKITRGRTPMPAYRSRFSDEDRWMLVHFIRSLERANPSSPSESQSPVPKTITKIEAQTGERPEVTGTNNIAKTAGTASAAAEKSVPETEPAPQRAETSRGEFVSRTEYEQLKSEHDQLKQEFESIKALLNAKPENEQPLAPAAQAQKHDAADAMEEEMEELRSQIQRSALGTTRHLLSGFASAGFTSRRHDDSAFSANFAPLFLWQMSDRILFEAELDLNLEGSETDVDLERAQISCVLNEYFTLGAGKFLSPMNFLEDRLHQVNKLPDKPVAIRELLPESNVGVQIRGGFPLGPTRFGYAFYAANAPEVRQDDPEKLGTLDFENFGNRDGHVAIGGRVGFYPISELEIGYGFQSSGLAAWESGADLFLQSVDLNYVKDFTALRGTVNLLAQCAWSDADSFIYDPAGSRSFGPIAFDNTRNGGFAQIAYRPTMVRQTVINRLEPIVRYEKFNQRRQPLAVDETRWSIGLNYWLMPSAVIKAAYQFGERSDDRNVEAVMFQFKIGF